MPIVQSSYQPPFFFRQGDLSTIYSAKIRRVQHSVEKREKYELSDGDFVNLDWNFASKPSETCILLLHGLEGGSDRPYIRGTAKHFTENNIDVCAMNFRSCGGEMNRFYGCYHSGQTSDLQEILNYLEQRNYKNIILKGISLGGNVALKFVGDNIGIPKTLKAVIAVSVPCDLAGSSQRIISRRNFVYGKNFHIQLINKLKLKQQLYPDKITNNMIKSIKNLWDFDEVYTSKAHGFKDAKDYYQQCSSMYVLDNIKIPTLILNAKNDSFLSKRSFPYEIAKNHEFLHLETPQFGGHVGFWQKGNIYYNEQRTLEFAQLYL